jgi:L-ascorbate metabolism protein UlaG (beta-lactamase superfamily)
LIDRRRQSTLARYPALWDRLISEWKSAGPEDRVWMMYSANYLFRTRSARWAIDPLQLNSRLPQALLMNVAADLLDLDFVLLTHRHADHLDLGLLHALRHLPICWVVPEDLLGLVRANASLSANHILVPRPMQSFDLNGLRITPFNAKHWRADPDRPSGRRGVPEMGYLVEQAGKRWLFPGDTRTYNISQLPDFGVVDLAFVHLWLGRASALLDPPPLIEEFCRFCAALQSRRLLVTHLNEFGRVADDYWDEGHFQQVQRSLQALTPHITVESAIMGESLYL